jgi:hypothetical protein
MTLGLNQTDSHGKWRRSGAREVDAQLTGQRSACRLRALGQSMGADCVQMRRSDRGRVAWGAEVGAMLGARQSGAAAAQ